MNDWTIWLATPLGVRLVVLAPLAFRWRRVLNGVGYLNVVVPYSSALRALLRLDSRLELWRAGSPPAGSGRPVLETNTVWLLRYWRPFVLSTGEQLIELGAVSANELLARRIVAYAAGSAQASKSGPADDVMKDVVTENYVTPTDVTRVLPGLAVAGKIALGYAVQKTFPRRPVLTVLREIALSCEFLGQALYFDVRGGTYNTPFEFRTWVKVQGLDHTATGVAPLTLSLERGSLGSAERPNDYTHEVNYVYAGGQGTGVQRVVATASDSARMNASPYNRRERFLDARHVPSATLAGAEAQSAVRAGRPVIGFGGQVVNRVGALYGVDWGWGDVVNANFAGDVLRCRVHVVQCVWDAGEETITAELVTDA